MIDDDRCVREHESKKEPCATHLLSIGVVSHRLPSLNSISDVNPLMHFRPSEHGRHLRRAKTRSSFGKAAH